MVAEPGRTEKTPTLAIPREIRASAENPSAADEEIVVEPVNHLDADKKEIIKLRRKGGALGNRRYDWPEPTDGVLSLLTLRASGVCGDGIGDDLSPLYPVEVSRSGDEADLWIKREYGGTQILLGDILVGGYPMIGGAAMVWRMRY